MMRIRPEQWELLELDAKRVLIEKYVRLGKRCHPSRLENTTDEQLANLCRSGYERAQAYGLKTEYNIFIFISTMIVLGSEFETDEKTRWCREILTDNQIGEDAKIKFIRLRVLVETREDVGADV